MIILVFSWVNRCGIPKAIKDALVPSERNMWQSIFESVNWLKKMTKEDEVDLKDIDRIFNMNDEELTKYIEDVWGEDICGEA